MNNIFHCRVCGRFGISEEVDLHEYRPLKNYKVEGKTLQVFDDYSWYPLKLEQVRLTNFDREKFRRRLDKPIKIMLIFPDVILFT